VISNIFRGALCLVAWGLAAAQVSGQTPAHEALKFFRRGANFGNFLEAPPNQDWGAHYSNSDLDHLKQEGFDHLRLPIAWSYYTGPAPDFKLRPEIFAKVDAIVTNALSRGLSAIINIHHFDDFTTSPAANTNKFYAMWRQIAEYYAQQPKRLAFELLNEPKDTATTEVMNAIYADVIQVIRKSNPDRTIFLGPSRWNSLDEVPKLKLPPDNNLIVTVHCYDPFYFTHQGATWTGTDVSTVGLVYPGPPPHPLTPDPKAALKKSVANWFQRYNSLPAAQNPGGPLAFKERMERVAAWGKQNNRPIHLGEFGAYEKADAPSRARYYLDMRKTAERLGFGWAMWDWKAGFKYWDGDKPAPGMHSALFGN
jgi:endoglucanase